MGGDKKKRKDKEKDKRKDKDKKKEKDDKKKKKDKYSSDSDDSASDDSSSSRSNSRKKKDKQKKIKKDKKSKKESPHNKQAAPSNNVPYNFDTVIPTNFSNTITGMKGMAIPVLPPPVPNTTSTASVPKPKSKQPNIFKLLPKLHYGAVLFGKTIFCGEYLSQSSLDKLLMEMSKNIEQTTKQQAHKKGMTNITKCMNQLQKIIAEENEERSKQVNSGIQKIEKQKNNRYELLEKLYNENTSKIMNASQ